MCGWRQQRHGCALASFRFAHASIHASMYVHTHNHIARPRGRTVCVHALSMTGDSAAWTQNYPRVAGQCPQHVHVPVIPGDVWTKLFMQGWIMGVVFTVPACARVLRPPQPGDPCSCLVPLQVEAFARLSPEELSQLDFLGAAARQAVAKVGGPCWPMVHAACSPIVPAVLQQPHVQQQPAMHQ